VPVCDTVAATVAAIRSGQRSAEETVRAALDRVHGLNDRLRAFLSVEADRALDRARAIDRARGAGIEPGPLSGVPVAVKDNLCTNFGATTCGSRMLDGFRSRYSAHVVERLEAAGAIIIGKTNLDEFAMGSSTEHSAWFPTRNPWDRSRVPGGSSGGSVVAVASGMVPGALGSDTGGSIRQPAALCGVVGLKPTYGRVSRYGLVAFGSSLDQIGPIARDVRDAALLLAVIAGHDPRDSTCVDRPVPDYTAALERPLRGTRVGICEEFVGDGLAPAVGAAMDAALEVMKRNGAEIVPIELPHVRYAIACYYLIAPAEASSNLARFDGVHFGNRSRSASNIDDLYTMTRGEGFGAEVKRRIMLGTFALSRGYHDQFYGKAAKVRTLIKQDLERAFEQVDVIASPVSPTTAFRIGEKAGDPLAMYLTDVYTVPANLAGVCAISVPAGFDDGRLPIGMQLMGPAFGEQKLLAVAHHFQMHTDHHTKRPPLAAAT
jgi:aspartyl-tRNA(Asn)/glutamyl-tRNA(Gln) amidotransferase subunit A